MCTERRGSNQRGGFHHNGSVDEKCGVHTGHVLLGFYRCMHDVTQKVGGVYFLFEQHICIQEIQEN